MAISHDKLAFSTAPPCTVLFVQHGPLPTGHRTPLHSHPFWQMELVVSGSVTWCHPGGAVALPRLQPLILPPQCRHGFRYGRRAEFVSVKFRIDHGASEPWLLPDAPPITALAETILLVASKTAMTHLASLAGLISAAVHWQSEATTATDFPLQVLHLVERKGCTRVDTVAAHLGCSPGYASSRWRQEVGGSLKQAIDRMRGERAANLLRYSELGLEAVAAAIGCHDAAAASRFISRTMGRSPRQIRAEGRLRDND